MISQEIKDLAVEVAGSLGERWKNRAAEDPEVWLVALLLNTKHELEKRRFTAMLDRTVEFSFFENRVAEAKRFLEEHRQEPASTA